VRLALSLWICSALSAACFDGQTASIGRVRSIAGNFETNLYGPTDSRPNTWGVADSTIHVLAFKPPLGCRVEILRIAGDFLAWPLGAVQEGTQAGVLVSFARSDSGGSRWTDAEEAADGCFLYVQAATDGHPARAAFDQRVVDGMLDTDNQLQVKMADWLNNTGRAIHMEVTFTVHFRFINGENHGS
jgi:hypothetical protein